MLRRHAAAFLATGCLLGVVVQAGAQTPADGGGARGLLEREILFHLYTGDPVTGIVKTLAGVERGQLDADHPQTALALGSMYLEYGEYRAAAEVFQGVLSQQVSPALSSRAWLYLAKLWYRSGRLQEAAEALARADTLPPQAAQERVLLRAQILMAGERFDEAAAVLAAGPLQGIDAIYARYNLGVALLQSGRREEGSALLAQIGTQPGLDRERLGLRDQANIVLGFSYLQADEPEQAREALQRIRLQGPFSNRALLATGWADADRHDYDAALVPWLALSRRRRSDPAVQEALLAIPYAYGEMGAYGRAAGAYQQAIDAFKLEQSELDDGLDLIRRGDLMAALAGGTGPSPAAPGDAALLLARGDLLPVIASNAVQTDLRNWRTLAAAQRRLLRDLDSVSAYSAMLDTRREAYRRRAQAVAARGDVIDIAALEARVDAVAGRWRRTTVHQDAMGFADADEQDQWLRLGAVREQLAQLPDTPDVAGLKARQRVLQGVLYWKLAAAYPERAWATRKELGVLRSELAQSRRRADALADARRRMPRRLDALEQRVAAVEPRLRRVLASTQRLMAAEEDDVERRLGARLQEQRARLADYEAQARFALAGVYDRVAGDAQAADARGIAP